MGPYHFLNHFSLPPGGKKKRASQVALVVKDPPANAAVLKRCKCDLWVKRSPGEGNGSPLQYSCLENPMDRGAWQATVWTWRSDWAHAWVQVLVHPWTVLPSRIRMALIMSHLFSGLQSPLCNMKVSCCSRVKVKRKINLHQAHKTKVLYLILYLFHCSNCACGQRFKAKTVVRLTWRTIARVQRPCGRMTGLFEKRKEVRVTEPSWAGWTMMRPCGEGVGTVRWCRVSRVCAFSWEEQNTRGGFLSREMKKSDLHS